jgi:fatty-acyl-CoA synthase
MQTLPEYARQVFVRLVSAIEMTGTFKLRQQDLVRQGYDPATTTDGLFVDDRDRESYVPVDSALFARLCSRGLRL